MRDSDYVYQLLNQTHKELHEKIKEVEALEKELKTLSEELSEIDEADLDETVDTFCEEE